MALESVGGYCSMVAVAAGVISPAPAPPVCHAGYAPSKGSLNCTPSVPQMPTASRGSVGIQPLRRPSWYDHMGAEGIPVAEEFPI